MTHHAGQAHTALPVQAHPTRTYLMHVLTVLDSGQVVVVTARTTMPWLRQTRPGWRIPPGGVTALGWINPDDPYCYRHAAAAAAATGWRTVGEWTTRGRRPAIQVRPDRPKLPRHGAGVVSHRKGH